LHIIPSSIDKIILIIFFSDQSVSEGIKVQKESYAETISMRSMDEAELNAGSCKQWVCYLFSGFL